MVLPISSLERNDGHPGNRSGVEGPSVDTVAVGVGAGYVEGFDAANGAKRVVRYTGVESVTRDFVGARDDIQFFFRYCHMQVAHFAAYRAIAVMHFEFRRAL